MRLECGLCLCLTSQTAHPPSHTTRAWRCVKSCYILQLDEAFIGYSFDPTNDYLGVMLKYTSSGMNDLLDGVNESFVFQTFLKCVLDTWILWMYFWVCSWSRWVQVELTDVLVNVYSLVKVRIKHWEGWTIDLVPAWIGYAVMPPGMGATFNGVHWDPPAREKYKWCGTVNKFWI